MPLITSRIPFSHQNPYRPVRPVTSKIIFLSSEGSVTEEEYFERIADLFSEIKSKIQFISVAEDAVHTAPKRRTTEIVRAKELHTSKTDLCPKYFVSTVYMLLDKMLDMLPQNG